MVYTIQYTKCVDWINNCLKIRIVGATYPGKQRFSHWNLFRAMAKGSIILEYFSENIHSAIFNLNN